MKKSRPHRVLLCSNFYYRRGGDGVYLFALADLLRNHGHEVVIFSMQHPENEPSEYDRHFVSRIDYAELNQRKNAGNVARVAWRSVYSLEARARLASLIRETRPDIAHLQNIHAYLTPSILAPLRSANIPAFWTLHDFKLLCPESSFLSNGRICEECRGGKFYRCAVNRCKKGSRAASLGAAVEAYVHQGLRIPRRIEKFICPSRFLQEKFLDFGWRDEALVHMPNFLPRLPTPRQGGAGYGVYAGGLRGIKGLYTLLRALAARPPTEFHIVGDGSERQALEAGVQELKLERVRFLGRLEGAALEEELIGADYGVLPSECYENCPYFIMEMMARGKPVIASRLGGIPELVEDGETGLLFDARDVTALAGCISAVLADPERAGRMGRAARKRAATLFDAEAYYARLSDLYDAAAASSGADAC